MRTVFFILILGVVFVGCQKDDSISTGMLPTITSMSPASATQGQQNVDGHIIGTNFTGVVAVDMGPGISILSSQAISATEFSVVFSVRSDAPAGPRTITVATAAGKAESTTAFNISDNKLPVANFTMNPSTAALNVDITFDASASTDSDGRVAAYSWDFGDGAHGDGKIAKHRYTSAGSVQVSLTVTDNHDAKATASRGLEVKNTVPPVAHYNFSPKTGNITTNFDFDGSSSTDDGRIVKFIWDFGDGEQVQGKLVHHKFTDSKEFKVKLTVVDNDELQDFVEKIVEIRGVPPVSRFDVSPSTGTTDTSFRFDGSSSNDIDGSVRDYAWKFGDGDIGSGKVVSHKYSRDGSFTVQLTVTDNGNLRDTSDRRVTVRPPQGPGDDDDDDDGGGTGNAELCSGANFDGQPFRVTSVSGNTVGTSVPLSTCPGKCGEIRRHATGIMEFVGDIVRISGTSVSINTGSLPDKTRPQPGENLHAIWRRCH